VSNGQGSSGQFSYTFQVGTNVIDILAQNVGGSGPAGLVFSAINSANGQILASTDSTWKWYWYNGYGDPGGAPWAWSGAQVDTWTLQQCASNALAAGAVAMMSTASYTNLSSIGRCNYYKNTTQGGQIYKSVGNIGWALLESSINTVPIVFEPFRYIKWYTNGSNVDSNSHLKHFYILDIVGNTSRWASSVSATGAYSSSDSLNSLLTSNVFSNTIITYSGPVTVTMDFGSIYSTIKNMYMAYSFNYLYKNTTISTSTDGNTWTTVYGPVNTYAYSYNSTFNINTGISLDAL
jgi:hypothetical protein